MITKWSRREVLACSLGAAGSIVGAGAFASRSRVRAIDVHHHFLPPFYKPVVEPWLRRFAGNVAFVLKWSPEVSLSAMDRAGIETAVLSISAPAIDAGSLGADIDLARRCNDYAAKLSAEHPGRFRFFAALPMPHVDASLKEAERALDHLGAQGVGLLSSYGGRYLGDMGFAPVFELLEHRRAIAYVHPTIPICCAGVVPQLNDSLIEMPADTGRTIGSLLWSGALSRYPHVRMVFSHGGGILPMVAERLALMGSDPHLAARVPEGAQAALARLYVDTASVTNRMAMAALRAWLPDQHILFGTDFPWGSPEQLLKSLDTLGLAPGVLAGVRRRNVEQLLGPSLTG